MTSVRFGRRWWRVAGVLLILAVPCTARAQLLEDPTIPAERTSEPRFQVPEPSAGHPGLDALLNFEFDRADSIFAAMERDDPRAPEPELGRGLLEWWRLVSGSEGGDPEKVERHLDRARKLSRDYGDRPGMRAEALYVSGRASSLLSALELINGSMMGAYRASQQTRSYLSKCLEEDPSFHDANLGLGLYHYYADALPKYLKLLGWVFGLKGDRELGLKQLRAAAARGSRTSPEALYFLANVYSNFEGQPDRGLDAIRWLVQRYPRNHVFFLEYMSALESLGYYREAEVLMRAALKQGGAFEHERAVRLMLGRNYYRQALYEEGAAVFEAELDPTEHSNRDPVRPWFYYFAGRCRDLLGQGHLAEQHYRRAEAFKIGGNVSALAKERRKDPESSEDRRLRHARGLLRRGDLAGAVDAWRTIVTDARAKRFETSIPIEQLVYRYALTLEETERYEDAKREYARIQEGEFVRRALLARIRCDHRAGRVEEALGRLVSLGASDSPVAAKARAIHRAMTHTPCEAPPPGDSTLVRRYRESEAWDVELITRNPDGGEICHPTRLVAGVWTADVPVAALRRGYYYRVDRSRAQPDPLSIWVPGEGDAVWSVAWLPDPFAEQAEWSGLSMY